VGRYTLSLLAEGDLDEIGAYTRREWGDAQCARYLDQLENACQLLADDFRRGRPCDDIRPGLFRRRIATLACANAALAAIGAIYVPVLLFTLGPILLGVAHVASDVRYLVLRRQLARWWQNAVWLGCLALIALRALEELGVLRQVERLELGVAVAFVAVALVAAIRERGSWLRAGLTGALLVVAAGLAWRHPSEARLVFLHLHNLGHAST
jgi:plasmid stabilization system protein ParE